MPSIDLRGFQDPLDPVRTSRQWQLDAALAALAALRGKQAENHARQRMAEHECKAQSDLAAHAWTSRGDPATQARLLAYLAGLQGRKLALEREAGELAHAVGEAQDAVLRLQCKVEVLERHRCDSLASYRSEQERKTMAGADQDWSARAALQGGEIP